MVRYKPNKERQDILFNDIIPSMVKRIKRNEFYYNGFFNKKCYYCNYKEHCHRELGL